MTEFEKMGCTYRQEGDYFLPNLKIGGTGRGANRRMGTATSAVPEKASPCTLLQFAHCWGAEQLSYRDDCKRRHYSMIIVMRLSEEENVTENLKATDPMEWVKRSNNIRNRATEIVNAEVIFV